MKINLGWAALLPLMAQAIEVELPPRATVIDRSIDSVELYQVPLSGVQESGRDLRIESSTTLSGQRERLTMEFPRGTQIDAIFDQLSLPNPVFECQARACGRSNLWANTLYQIPQLYGRDRNQRYQAVQTDQGLRTLYVIERGTQEVYAHLERISDSAGAGVVALDVELEQGGLLPASLSALREAVEARPALRWELHVRISGNEGYAQALGQSRDIARGLTQQVASIGINVKNQGPSESTQITLLGFQP